MYKIVEVFSETNWESTLSEKNLENDKVNVYIFHLEPVADVDASNKNLIFKRNDATMNTITDKVLRMVPNAALIYTASEPSQVYLL